MPDLIMKARYFKIGQSAPKNSCFKGTITPSSIFGGSNSYFSYTERYSDIEKNKDGSLLDYTGRYGYTMSSEGLLDSEEKKKAFKQKGMECLCKEGSVVYELIVSLKDYDTADGYHLSNQEQFSVAIDKIMPSYIRSLGLDPDNVSWWEDFHSENRTSITPHPHIHLLFYENEPSHSFDHLYGKLPKKSLNDFKRMFANEMIRRQDQSKYRELFDDINISKTKVLDRVRHIDLDRVKTVKDLYAILPDKGRLQINSYHMAPYRETIYKVVDRLLESKECRKQWNSYKEALQRYDSMNSHRYWSLETGDYYWQRSDRGKREITKTKKQIANLILQGKKDFIRDNSYDRLLSNDNYRSADGDKGKIYKDPSIVRDRLSSRNPDRSIRKGISGLLAKRQKEIEKEIDQYLGKGKGYGMSL
ncbi:MAG: hypothetical protein IIY30_06650 [Erysipelotrichaceae bacterium]|nr:hypothetical protein [Erysipelotrichaceae bacterium]